LAKLYMAEQFPTRLRASGSMLGESITRFLGGVVLVYLFPILDAQLGQGRLFVILGILTEICLLPIWLYGFQTSGISVEQTGTDVRVGDHIAVDVNPGYDGPTIGSVEPRR
jgi:putative MFS transporter